MSAKATLSFKGIDLPNTLLVKDFKKTLLSWRELAKQGCKMFASNDKMVIFDKD
jgi:hypothetical protein